MDDVMNMDLCCERSMGYLSQRALELITGQRIFPSVGNWKYQTVNESSWNLSIIPFKRKLRDIWIWIEIIKRDDSKSIIFHPITGGSIFSEHYVSFGHERSWESRGKKTFRQHLFIHLRKFSHILGFTHTGECWNSRLVQTKTEKPIFFAIS